MAFFMDRIVTLGAFFTGDAEFQTFHGILAELAERKNLSLKTFAYSRTVREFPHAKKYLINSKFKPTIHLKRTFELFPKHWLSGIDALLVIRDPHSDPSNPRRCRHILENNVTTILLDHSVWPEYWMRNRISSRAKPFDYYSELVFQYERLTGYESIFSKDTLSKIRYSGIIKKLHITPKVTRYYDLLKSFEKTILFTHEFRTILASGRLTDSVMSEYFRMVTSFAQEHPNYALIIRPHRGRAKPWHEKHDEYLMKNCKNVFFSNQRSGLFKGAMLNDLLEVSDALVSTPSTAIVDSVYLDTPVAVALNDDSKFNNLAQVNSVESLKDFLENTNAYSKVYNHIRNHYGDIDNNISKVCDAIENFLLR